VQNDQYDQLPINTQKSSSSSHFHHHDYTVCYITNALFLFTCRNMKGLAKELEFVSALKRIVFTTLQQENCRRNVKDGIVKNNLKKEFFPRTLPKKKFLFASL